MMFADKINISYLINIRNADSRAGCILTNSRSCNSICNKPTLPCIFSCLPRQQNFLPIRFEIGDHGAKLHSNSSQSVKLGAVPNSICGNNGSFQPANPNTREEIYLDDWRMTHKILDTAPFTFSWSIATPSRDTIKMGCDSDGPLAKSAVNWNT